MLTNIALTLIIFVVSFYSVLSGGVGLLTRPILILFGVPPAIALGSFRVANLLGRLAGLPPLLRAKEQNGNMDWKLALFLFIPSFIGGIIGAETVAFLNEALIRRIIGIFVLLMGSFLLFKKEIGLQTLEEKTTIRKNVFAFFATILIGFVASFLGGSGILFVYLMILVYHKSFITSAAIRKVTNFGSALSASILFIYYGDVDWTLTLLLFIADGLGEYLGARYQIKKGEKWVRNITLIIVLATGIAMLL